jgi:hypothetical protein
MKPQGSLPCIQEPVPIPRPCVTFRNKMVSYGEELLAPHPTLKLEDHPLLAVRDYLFNILEATFHMWRPLLHPSYYHNYQT